MNLAEIKHCKAPQLVCALIMLGWMRSKAAEGEGCCLVVQPELPQSFLLLYKLCRMTSVTNTPTPVFNTYGVFQSVQLGAMAAWRGEGNTNTHSSSTELKQHEIVPQLLSNSLPNTKISRALRPHTRASLRTGNTKGTAVPHEFKVT